MHGQSCVKLFIATCKMHLTVLFDQFKFGFCTEWTHFEKSFYSLIFRVVQTNMAQKVTQETAEYYKWLIRIKRAEFERELLDKVSIYFDSLIHINWFSM